MRLDLLGYGLQVEGAPPKLQAWLEDYWGFSYPKRFSNTPVTLRVVANVPADFPQDAPQIRASFAEGSVPCINQDPLFWLGDTDCGVRLDICNLVLEVWGEREAQFTLLHIALSEVLRIKGLLPLHAAVVVKNGLATAFLGASGSGKTTALLSAVEKGYQALAEDFVWLEPETFKVHRWDRGIRLLPDTLKRFKRTVAGCSHQAVLGKCFIRYSDLGWTPPEGVLSGLYILCPEDTFGVPQTLTRVEATRLFWEATGVPLSKYAREHTGRVLPSILKQLNLQALSRNASLPI